MNTLFPIEPAYPEGFSYIPIFIDAKEEQQVLDEIAKLELHNFSFQGYQANRKVASFGYDYSFDNGSLTKGKEIPKTFEFLIEKVSKFLSIEISEFAELLITE